MDQNQFTYEFGAPGLGEPIAASDMLVELDHFLAALRAADKEYLPEGQEVKYFIDDASRTNPLKFAFAGVNSNTGEFSTLGPRKVADLLNAVKHHGEDALREISHELRQALLVVTRSTGKLTGTKELVVGGKVATVTVNDAAKIVPVLEEHAALYYVHGTIKGTILRVVQDVAKPYFRLVPPTGPDFINCIVQDADAEQVWTFGGRYVAVHGRIQYREQAVYPEAIFVDEVIPEPTGDARTDLSELVGLVPDITGDQDSIDFVKEIRRGW
jgi:hypothetical protein